MWNEDGVLEEFSDDISLYSSLSEADDIYDVLEGKDESV